MDGYYTKVKNGIIFFQLTPSRFTYKNIDRYDSKGVNVAASVSLPWGFAPSVAYAYNKRENPEGAEVGGYPNHSGFLKLLWANPRLGLRANIRGQINGKVPPGVDGTYQPSYDLWSAQVSKRFAEPGRLRCQRLRAGRQPLRRERHLPRQRRRHAGPGSVPGLARAPDVPGRRRLDMDWAR